MLYGFVIGILVLGVMYDGALYFLIARNDAEAAYDYRADLTQVAQYIKELVARGDERPYLVLDTFSLQTVHFLASVAAHDYLEHPDQDNHAYDYLDPGSSHETPPEIGRHIIFTQSTIPDADRYEQTYPDSIELVESRRNRFNEEIMRVYKGVAVEGVEDNATQFDLDA